MANSVYGLRLRLLEDTRHGRAGSIVLLPLEYAEALVQDRKASIVYDKSMSKRGGLQLKGGIDSRKGAC